MDIQQINIQPFLSGSRHDTFLLEIGGRFFEIGKDAAELLKYLKENGINNKSIDEYISNNNGRPSKDEVEAFLDGLDKKTNKEAKAAGGSFLYSKDFIPAALVGRFSFVLGRFFSVWVMLPVCVLFAVLEIVYFLFIGSGSSSATISIYLLALMYVFLVLSSLIHEFGHASACRRFGVEHGDIGVGLYLNLPVFYTDVSHIWKLSRKQRCVVNFGGVYFQIIMLVPLLGIAIITDNAILNSLIVLMNLNFLITMNPFFKFDGYWMMTDLLGVANLRQKGKEWTTYIINKMRGRKTDNYPYMMSLAPWARYTFVIYTVVVSLFFAFYFLYGMPMFLMNFCETFPDRLYVLLSQLAMRKMPSWGNLQQMVLQLLFFFFFIYMIIRVVYPLTKKIQWKKR